MALLIEKSSEGRVGLSIPKSDVPNIPFSSFIDSKYIRTEAPDLPELSEPQVVRHYTNLSVKNHHIDKNFYPLGSCTMKYNPKINDSMAMLPHFSGVHPNQAVETVQGALHLMYELEQMLVKITGMSRVTLQPSAGSQGEFVGLLIMQQYHSSKNNEKKYVIIPETAHGTNPASVILAGYKVRKVGTNSEGRVDIDDLKNKLDENVAGMMLTQPNTLGLFENDISEISELIHSVDGLMYMDGANLNALVGLAYPSEMGFDIAHINLHKTFSTPHGGGGPGSGPIAVVDKLVQFLPIPMIDKKDNMYILENDNSHSIGHIHSFFGNFGILVRAYTYIRLLGEKGVKNMTRKAILNANYLKSKLINYYDIPFPNGSMHEFVISAHKQKQQGAKALDIAKALLDYGFHSPTVYFPINVAEAMMIEPTESETKETLDSFVLAMIEINKNIVLDLSKLLDAPTTTPVRRLDETKANRDPNVRW